MRLYTTITLLIITLQLSAHTTKIDSLKHVMKNKGEKEKVSLLIEIGREYYQNYPDSAMLYSDSALKLIEKHNQLQLLPNAFIVKGHAYRELRDYNNSKEYFHKAIEAGSKYGEVEQTGMAYSNLGVVYQITNEYDKAITTFNKAIKLFLEINDNVRLGRAYDNLGIVYFLKGDLNLALENFLRALEYFQITMNEKAQSSSMYKISSVYSALENFPEAVKYAQRAYDQLKDSGEVIEIVRALNNLGIIYRNNKMYEKALEYYMQALEVAEKLPTLFAYASISGNIGVVYTNLKNYEKALEYHQKALEIAKNNGDKNLLATTYNNIADAQYYLNDYKKAEENFKKSAELFEEMNETSNILKPYQRLYEINKTQSRYNAALNFLEKHIAIKDSMMQSQRVKSLDSLLTLFNTKELENENLILAQETKIKTKTIENQRLSLILSIVVILLITSFTIVVLRNRRKLKVAYNIVNEKNSEILVFSEELSATNEKLVELDNYKTGLMQMIVHDLKDPLSMLINAPTLFEGKQFTSFVQHISSNMLTLVLNILDVNKYEESSLKLNLTSIQLHDVLHSIMEQLKMFYEQSNISIEISDRSSCLLMADADIIKRLIINLLTNAIKYSPKNSVIKIDATKEGSFVKIRVIDYGVGIAAENHDKIFKKYVQLNEKESGTARSTGIGLYFCKIATEAHGGSIGVESNLGKGSTFWVTIPIAEATDTSQEISDTIYITEQQELVLEEKDKIIISKIARELENVKIFELTKIKNAVNKISGTDSPILKQWAGKLMQIVYSGNEALYKQMLSEKK